MANPHSAALPALPSLLPAGVRVAECAARPPDGAVALEAAAEAKLPHAVPAPHAAGVLDVAQDVPVDHAMQRHPSNQMSP